MAGYYNDPDATARAMGDGWFRTGDAAVVHPDGYMEIRDRIKDVIISGGENISSVEVEGALLRHPAVDEAAIVGLPSEKGGRRRTRSWWCDQVRRRRRRSSWASCGTGSRTSRCRAG